MPDIEARVMRLYRDAAAYINDAGMTWTEYWNLPTSRLARYARACDERNERIRSEQERAARR